MRRMVMDDVKVCNCAECGKELFFRSSGSQVAGRIKGRPYCENCLETHSPPPGISGPMEDTGPWQDIAIRNMEDGAN